MADSINQRIWIAVRTMKTFSLRAIVDKTKINPATVRGWISAWEKAGVVKCKNPDDAKCTLRQYELVKNTGLHAPMINFEGERIEQSRNQKIWMAIKVLKKFKAQDVTLVTQGHLQSTRNYLKYLEKGGYIKVLAKGKDFQESTIYMFLSSKDTGPKAPAIKNRGDVYDQNKKKTVFRKVAA